jgi:hypothetical protein
MFSLYGTFHSVPEPIRKSLTFVGPTSSPSRALKAVSLCSADLPTLARLFSGVTSRYYLMINAAEKESDSAELAPSSSQHLILEHPGPIKPRLSVTTRQQGVNCVRENQFTDKVMKARHQDFHSVQVRILSGFRAGVLVAALQWCSSKDSHLSNSGCRLRVDQTRLTLHHRALSVSPISRLSKLTGEVCLRGLVFRQNASACLSVVILRAADKQAHIHQ